MNIKYLFSLDGIRGESREAGYEGWMHILDWNWGQSQLGFQAGSGAGSGVGAGRVQMEDFRLELPIGTAVPRLMQACAAGQHFKEARILGGWEPKSEAFLKIQLSEVIIAAFQMHGSSGDQPLRVSIGLSFAAIRMEIQSRDQSGKLQGAVTAGWDVKTNSSL